MLRRSALPIFVLIFLALCGGGREACALPGASDIQGILSSGSPVIEGFALDKADLADFYKARDYKAVWNFSGAGNKDALATFLASAEGMVIWHGLRRGDYPFDPMRKLAAAAPDDASQSKLEILVMDTLLRLARDLHGDTVDLDDLYPGWTFRRQPVNIPEGLAEAASAQGISAFLETLIPAQPAYQALAQALAAYRQMAERGGWRPIAPGPTLRPGERSPRVAQLRARLEAEEALTFPADTALAQPKSGSARRDGGSSTESSKARTPRAGALSQGHEQASFASAVAPGNYRFAQPRLSLPNANQSFLMLQFSRAFERFAPLEVAPQDSRAATQTAEPASAPTPSPAPVSFSPDSSSSSSSSSAAAAAIAPASASASPSPSPSPTAASVPAPTAPPPAPPFAALPHAPFAGAQASDQKGRGVSMGWISLDPDYPGQPAVSYRSTPLQEPQGGDSAAAPGGSAPAHEDSSGASSQPEAPAQIPAAQVPAQGQEQNPPSSVAAPDIARQPPAAPNASVPPPSSDSSAAPVSSGAPGSSDSSSSLSAVPSSPRPQDSAYFDEGLQEALKLWQIRNGLDGDGNLGPKTLEMLNAPASDRIEQIRANMERWRHMPEDYPMERYARVNIADASLLLVEDGKIAYQGPVVVGRVDRKTPFIHSKIRSMIVNPFWHVPAKIARKDILPKLRRDPHYLEKLGFVISGNAEDPHGANIDWGSMPEREFNFRLRQSPGDANSLGRIKFDFDNNFAVYMHGTPHQELFGKDRRNFSSGCIRLRDPLEVAEAIMSANAENWSERKLADAIESGKTRWVAVAKPLPLLILYETVFVDFSGKLQFRKDVYNYDRFLIETLASKAM